jgi:hypothetical protein
MFKQSKSKLQNGLTMNFRPCGKPPIWHVKEISIPMCTCNLERYMNSIWLWKLLNNSLYSFV